MTPKELAKQLNISNTGNLEKRIRRELEEQGENGRLIIHICSSHDPLDDMISAIRLLVLTYDLSFPVTQCPHPDVGDLVPSFKF